MSPACAFQDTLQSGLSKTALWSLLYWYCGHVVVGSGCALALHGTQNHAPASAANAASHIALVRVIATD
jgi:hypothetical protein